MYAMLLAFSQKGRSKRGGLWTGLLSWFFRRRKFQSVHDESDDGQGIPSEEEEEDEDELVGDDQDDDDDAVSGYLDITIVDLRRTESQRSQRVPNSTELTSKRIVSNAELKSQRLSSTTEFTSQRDLNTPQLTSQRFPNTNANMNGLKIQQGPTTELKSPSAVDLTRSRAVPSPTTHSRVAVVSPYNSPTSPNFSMVKVMKQPPQASKFARNRTQESFQGSLESIDSLVESYWDPEDDASNITPRATNLARSSEFFHEHVRFLRVQTQPRQVEVVWNTPPNTKTSQAPPENT